MLFFSSTNMWKSWSWMKYGIIGEFLSINYAILFIFSRTYVCIKQCVLGLYHHKNMVSIFSHLKNTLFWFHLLFQLPPHISTLFCNKTPDGVSWLQNCHCTLDYYNCSCLTEKSSIFNLLVSSTLIT